MKWKTGKLRKIPKSEVSSFGKINKVGKSLVGLIKIRRENTVSGMILGTSL